MGRIIGTVNRAELLPNPGFEVNTTGWATINGTITRDTSVALSGAASGRFDGAANAQLFANIGLSGPTAGRRFAATRWLYVPPGSPAIGQAVTLQMYAWGGASGSAVCATRADAMAEGWQQHTVAGAIVENDRTVLYCRFYFNGPAATVYLDDASLVDQTYPVSSGLIPQVGLTGFVG